MPWISASSSDRSRLDGCRTNPDFPKSPTLVPSAPSRRVIIQCARRWPVDLVDRGRVSVKSESVGDPQPHSPAPSEPAASRPLSRPVQVLIADDREVIRVGLRTMFLGLSDIRVVAETGTAKQTISDAQRLRPDLVLLRHCFSDGTGAAVCRSLCQMAPAPKVLILSLDNTTAAFCEAIESGAQGYLLPTVNREELIAAVRAVSAGSFYIDGGATHHVLSALRAKQTTMEQENAVGLHHVSPQERKVLSLVSEGKTNKEIAAQLSLSEKTVKNYLAHTYKKLGIGNRAQAAVRYAQVQAHTSNGRTP